MSNKNRLKTCGDAPREFQSHNNKEFHRKAIRGYVHYIYLFYFFLNPIFYCIGNKFKLNFTHDKMSLSVRWNKYKMFRLLWAGKLCRVSCVVGTAHFTYTSHVQSHFRLHRQNDRCHKFYDQNTKQQNNKVLNRQFPMNKCVMQNVIEDVARILTTTNPKQEKKIRLTHSPRSYFYSKSERMLATTAR